MRRRIRDWDGGRERVDEAVRGGGREGRGGVIRVGGAHVAGGEKLGVASATGGVGSASRAGIAGREELARATVRVANVAGPVAAVGRAVRRRVAAVVVSQAAR